MQKTRAAFAALILLIGTVHSANAVENGTEATGSQFVVPIKIEIAPGLIGWCSGALISPYIVVTAGHCVVDLDGALTTKVYVGKAGSSLQSVKSEDIIDSIRITSTFHSEANSTVGDDDLAFITLKNAQIMPLPVSIASESELIAIKNAGGPLELFGYGKYGDNSEDEITYPKSFTGVYSELPTMYTNSAYMESSIGNACTGDSGGPILSITAEQITVIGITTGGTTSNYCTKLQNGSSYVLFTLINRYANLAFSSANDSTISISQLYNKTLVEGNLLKSQLATTTASLGVVSKKLEIAQILVVNANTSNAILHSQLELVKKTNLDLVAKIRKICSVKPKIRGC